MLRISVFQFYTSQRLDYETSILYNHFDTWWIPLDIWEQFSKALEISDLASTLLSPVQASVAIKRESLQENPKHKKNYLSTKSP